MSSAERRFVPAGRPRGPDRRRAVGGYAGCVMGPLAVRRVTCRVRRHAASVLVALALGAVIGLHHSELAAGDMHHDGMGTVIELCLGVFTAVGATVAALAIAVGALGGWSRPRHLLPAGVHIVLPRTPEPRAGPPRRACVRTVATVAALAVPLLAASPAIAANTTDRAFVRQMVPHHQMATEMADMAGMDCEHAKLRRLARQIVEAQEAEIKTLERIAENLGVTPADLPMDGEMSDQTMRDLETLGVTKEESGMTMDMHDLHGAKPFDRAFIDMMIPHHQGAIRMARAELAKGKNRRLRRIARSIVRDQKKEIRTMNEWREAWYGPPLPAGGVPNP